MKTNFTQQELTHSAVAIAHGIDNAPPPEAQRALNELTANLLAPLLAAYGKPIAVTSGFRAPAVNALISGASTGSQHTRGEAADCFTGDDPDLLLQTLLGSGLDFDQAITYRSKKILHLSYCNQGNRCEVLRR